MYFFHRHLLHHCFQALMDHGVKVASVLANSFSRRCSYIAESEAHVKEKAIQFGFVLGRRVCVALKYLYYLLLVLLTLLPSQVASYRMPVGMEMPRRSSCLVSSCAHYTMRFFTGIVQWSAASGESLTFIMFDTVIRICSTHSDPILFCFPGYFTCVTAIANTTWGKRPLNRPSLTWTN